MAINEILKRDMLSDIVMKSIEKYDIYNVAISFVLRNHSDDALELINAILKVLNLN